MAWFLTFHLLGLIVWMGALLDLTRILGYHVSEEIPVQTRLSFMEFRIFFFVATPGLIVTLLFGTLLFFHGGGIDYYLKGATVWFHAKLSLVIFLLGIHTVMGKHILKLRSHPQKMKPAKFKALHGVTALTLILILILVLVKPF